MKMMNLISSNALSSLIKIADKDINNTFINTCIRIRDKARRQGR